MPPRTNRRAGAALAVVLLGAGTAAACTSGADTRATSTQQTRQSPAALLQQVKGVVDRAPSMHLTLTSSGIPTTATAILGGSGDGNRRPGFAGTMTVRLAGAQANVPVIAVGEKVWAELPIWQGMRPIDPTTYGAPNPARYFSTTTGLTALLPRTQGPVLGEERREGADVVRPVTGTLAGKDVVDVLGVGDPSGRFEVEYLITAGGELRALTLTGRFYNDARSSYTLKLDGYGKSVAITPPA